MVAFLQTIGGDDTLLAQLHVGTADDRHNLHQVTQELDGGRIVHQKGATLCRGDGLHMLAARTTRDFFNEVIPLISSCVEKNFFLLVCYKKRKGKLWLKSDWRPEQLQLIYGLFNDKIVDEYLSGKLPNTKPSLTSAFE